MMYLEDIIYIKHTTFFCYSSVPFHTPIPRKNLVVTVYNTDNYLACDIIAQQRIIFDEIISKQALNIDQVIQVNV